MMFSYCQLYFVAGFKNISNCLSIRDDYDLSSPNLKDAVEQLGSTWDGKVDFKAVFKNDDSPADEEGSREKCGRELLAKLSQGENTSRVCPR
jgi:hypothetical protein